MFVYTLLGGQCVLTDVRVVECRNLDCSHHDGTSVLPARVGWVRVEGSSLVRRFALCPSCFSVFCLRGPVSSVFVAGFVFFFF